MTWIPTGTKPMQQEREGKEGGGEKAADTDIASHQASVLDRTL